MSDPNELQTTAPGSGGTEDRAAHRLAAIIESSDDAIVSKDLEMHGGTISASSPGEGEGSTFLVRLPVMMSIEPAVAGDSERRL